MAELHTPVDQFASDLIKHCHGVEESLNDLAINCPSMARRNGLLMKREGVALVREYVEEMLR